MSREPIEIVEIDVPQCSRVYGTLPCTAALGTTGVRKCFNTRATCQDTAHFALGTEMTLRFARAGRPLPKGTQAFPTITDLSQSSTTVNIAGSDPRYGSLGQRGTLQVKIGDFTWHDRGTDPYAAGRVDGTAQVDEGGYDPAGRGTFLAKLKARWPNYAGASIRLKRGYLVAGALTDITTYNYVVKEIAGPTDGVLTINAVGVLDLANEKTALAPKPSPGVLSADITNSATSFTVTPSGAGASYASSGWVCIGSEVMSFTRSGDTFTVVRAQRGTTAATHSAADTVQQTLSYRLQRLDTVAIDLIDNFTTIDATTWIPTSTWAAEVTRWGSGILLTTDICTPTSVATLLAELGDLGCTIVEDERAQKLRLRMNRPVDGEAVYTANDRTVRDLKQVDRDEDRITQVLFFSKQADPTKSLSDESNYTRKMLTVNSDALALYGDVRTKKIFTRWLNQGDDTTVAIVSTRQCQRFASAPMRVTITLDAVDKDIGLMDIVQLTTDDMADPTGASVMRLMQVVKRSEPEPYHSVEVELQRFDFNRRYGHITANTQVAYGSASDAEKLAGGFISNGVAAFADGAEPYRII